MKDQIGREDRKHNPYNNPVRLQETDDQRHKRLLAQAVIDLIDCQNRYKDGLSDEQWTDAEMALRKTLARDNGVKLLRDLGLYPEGRRI